MCPYMMKSGYAKVVCISKLCLPYLLSLSIPESSYHCLLMQNDSPRTEQNGRNLNGLMPSLDLPPSPIGSLLEPIGFRSTW